MGLVRVMRGRWAVIALGLVCACVAGTRPAQAWWRGGWGGGFVVGIAPPAYYYPPPAYYAPPAYYYPPPVTYAPPPAYYAPPPASYTPLDGAAAQRGCYAGAYVCPLERVVPVGGACSCPVGGNARIGGYAR